MAELGLGLRTSDSFIAFPSSLSYPTMFISTLLAEFCCVAFDKGSN